MFYPDVTAKEWIKRYPELHDSEPTFCDCGKEMKFSIPFIKKDWIGLKAPECPCGETGEAVVQITKSKEAKEKFQSLFRSLSESY